MLVISIDLWGTLIKGSPLFGQHKILLTQKYFPDASQEQIASAYSEAKDQLNNLVEMTGTQPPEDLMFNLLASKIRGDRFDSSPFITEFAFEYQELAKEFHPVLYSGSTKECLSRLKELGSLQISSNTMFINGSVLHWTLKKLEIADLFTECYFSDKMNCAKPNSRMFSGASYHIGDNPLTDGYGARLSGCTPIIINSNKKTIVDAYNLITQNG